MTAIEDSDDSVYAVEPAGDALENGDGFDDRMEQFFDTDSGADFPDEIVVEAASGGTLERLQERRLRARKVRRLLRHVEPWSVLKVALIFNFCMWVVTMVAGVLLWNAAETAGTIDDVEQFALTIFALEEFEFKGEEIFNAIALGGLLVAVAATGFAVLVAILLNLISDLTGGIRVTVVEEETARPVATLPRRG